jgi:hypothetical protein
MAGLADQQEQKRLASTCQQCCRIRKNTAQVCRLPALHLKQAGF